MTLNINNTLIQRSITEELQDLLVDIAYKPVDTDPTTYLEKTAKTKIKTVCSIQKHKVKVH